MVLIRDLGQHSWKPRDVGRIQPNERSFKRASCKANHNHGSGAAIPAS